VVSALFVIFKGWCLPSRSPAGSVCPTLSPELHRASRPRQALGVCPAGLGFIGSRRSLFGGSVSVFGFQGSVLLTL